MAIITRSPKTRVFWKSAKGGSREIFQKSPKNLPLLKEPKKTLKQMQLVCTYSAKTGQDLGANSGSKSARMAKLWQFSQGHPKPAFFEKVQKRGPREIV